MTELNPYQPPESAEADVDGDDHVLERRLWYLCLVGASMLVLGLVLTVGATIILFSFTNWLDVATVRQAAKIGGLAGIGGTVLIVVSAIAVFMVRMARAKRTLRR